MSWASTVAAIRGHFVSTFTALPVIAENGSSTPPASGFVILSPLSAERQQMTLGRDTAHYLTPVLLEVEVYVPIGTGTALVDSVGDAVEIAWSTANVTGLKVYETQRPVYLGEQGGWYRANVTTRAAVED
jgi:hypothetical protein